METSLYSIFFDEDGYVNVIVSLVQSFISNYGWYILFTAFALTITYNLILDAYYKKYQAWKFEKEYSAKYHKNPDVFAAHVNAQQQWAEKLQKKYNKDSQTHQQKLKEKEEKRRQELLDSTSSIGHTLGSKKDDKPTGLRSEYNPLMGPGNSSNYRPPRRSPCGSGGCGK